MTETASQLLSHVVPICQWNPQITRNPSSTLSAYPRFPEGVREWTGFFRGVRLAGIQYSLPGGHFPVFPTDAQSLSIEKDAEDRFFSNVLCPVKPLLGTLGAIFCRKCPGLFGSPDYVLCTNDSTDAKMPVEMKTRHNLNLCGYHLWQIYRKAQRRSISNSSPDFKFTKKILLQIFGTMACNGLHYGILSNYSDTYFLKREEASQTTLYVTHVVQPGDTNPTLRECVYYISQLAVNDNAGVRLNLVKDDNYSSNGFDDDAEDPDDNSDDNLDDPDYFDDPDDSDDSDDSDDDPSRKMKQGSKRTGSSKKVVASPSKGITTIDQYIGGGTFGNVFSGYYHGQAVAWKTCDAYKEKEAKKTLRVEANMYSILKDCQGNTIPRLLYEGYVYDGYLYVLALQLIEDARHIDPENLTVEEKRTIVQQLETIHNYGVLHNDIAQRNILMEPKSRRFFFIDFGLSEFVGTKSKKLYKEKKKLKNLLQI
ncbi:hypothetical protein Glove_134g264 [Diversispora epigaea]|uniref:Protein kinase domain-containing protein n=1 Tax=Diversispora epigaea TaxID=1348612 RepID=A0A397IWY8_9GLOM|nr:hypothetical protein Glove_134g264 [Diversispora epigaea]